MVIAVSETIRNALSPLAVPSVTVTAVPGDQSNTLVPRVLRLGDGIGRERVPGPAPDNVAQVALGRLQVGPVRPDDVQVAVEDEVGVRRGVE